MVICHLFTTAHEDCGFPHFVIGETEDHLMTCLKFPSLAVTDFKVLGSKTLKFYTLVSS